MSHFIILLLFLFPLANVSSQVALLEKSILSGEKIYLKKCSAFHGKDGLGKGKRIPPLANSDYLETNIEESIRGIIFGQEGEIIVNGIIYNKNMKAIKLTDQEVADVMNYVLNSWGNKNSSTITKERISKVRMAMPEQ